MRRILLCVSPMTIDRSYQWILINRKYEFNRQQRRHRQIMFDVRHSVFWRRHYLSRIQTPLEIIIDIRSVLHLRIVQYVCVVNVLADIKWCQIASFVHTFDIYFFCKIVMHEGGTRVNAHIFINATNGALQVKLYFNFFYSVCLFWHLFYDGITHFFSYLSISGRIKTRRIWRADKHNYWILWI